MVSRRIETIASLCPFTGPLIDIGSDHGQLLQVLIQKGFAFPLHATELSEASFKGLRHALQDLNVHVYQANGLTHLSPSIETVVITGMGGNLIQEILDGGKSKLAKVNTIILGPQRDPYIVRTWLQRNQWNITHETFVYEDEKGYPFIIAKKGNMTLTEMEAWYGPWLIRKQEPEFLTWLRLEAKQLTADLKLHKHDVKQLRLEWIQQYVKNR